MKLAAAIVPAIALALVLLGLSACSPAPAISGPSGPPEVKLPDHYLWVGPDEAERLIASTPDLKVLDLRMDEEIRSGRGWVPGATWSNAFGPNSGIPPTLDKNQPCLIYCALGPRSELTAAAMAKAGFEKVYLLKGGFNAWVAANKSVQK